MTTVSDNDMMKQTVLRRARQTLGLLDKTLIWTPQFKICFNIQLAKCNRKSFGV